MFKMKTRILRTPHLKDGKSELKREEIRRYFHNSFDTYESLFKTLRTDEAYYRKAISLRHPLIFYYGHTATFFVNKLVLAGVITERINPSFESMFAVGVDEMSWDDLDNKNYSWPTVQEVYLYRTQVRHLVDKLIGDLPLNLPITWESPWWAIMMGIEHEKIHLETSSVLIRQLALKYVQPHPDWAPCSHSGKAPQNQFISVGVGTVARNNPQSDSIYYGWDNEYGYHSSEVASFQASQYLVSHQEFFEFMKAGGYLQESFWEPEGWSWKNYAKAEHPTFWVKNRDKDEWLLRTMTQEIPMPWNWPVEVNFHEAKAFCRWKTGLSG